MQRINLPTAVTCFCSCSLLTLISHLVPHHFFQTRAGCCRVVLPPALLLRVVSGERGTTAWRGFWWVTRRWWQAKVNRAQHFPMKAWLPHRGKSANLSEACLPVYREENKKWFSLFLFHPAVLQLTSLVKENCCVFIWNVLHLEQWFSFNVNCLFIIPFYLCGWIKSPFLLEHPVSCVRNRGSSVTSGGLLESE